MDVWAAVWEYPSDNETNFTLWTAEKDALEKVCDEIADKISNDWDLDDHDMSLYAAEISASQERGSLREAMDKWNEYQANYNDDYAQYYSVLPKQILIGNSGQAPKGKPVPYQAKTSGATCRGPCGQHNEYAYADRPDGTHVCRQCSTFQHIFGVKS